MVATTRPGAIAKSAGPRLALIGILFGGLLATGCFGNPRNFHPGQGYGGTTGGGQGGYVSGGGQGGYAGQGGGGGSTTTCSTGTTPSFLVRWSLEDAAGAATTCAAVGGATMDLDVLEVATSVATHDTFPCTAMMGTSMALAPGNYSIAMRLRDAAGALLSEGIAPMIYPITAGCSTDLGLVPFGAIVTTADQYITLSWAIVRVANDAPLSCAGAHATQVELDVDANTFRWPCADGTAATGSMTPGTSSVTAKLLDATGTVLSVTPTVPVTVTAGQPKALGTVTFGVN